MSDLRLMRSMLLQMECGVIGYDGRLREYLRASLDFAMYRARADERRRRRWFQVVKALVLLGFVGLVSQELPMVFWAMAAVLGRGFARGASDLGKERNCWRHYEGLLQMVAGSGAFPYEWQSRAPAASVRQYAESLEWDLEWRLRGWERWVFFLLVGVVFVGFGLGFAWFWRPLFCCCWELG